MSPAAEQKQLSALEAAIGYRFANPALLRQAMAHPSLNIPNNNQRLEFLGDAILSAAVAEILFTLFPEEPEGDLARRLAGLVRGNALAEMALSLGIEKAMLISAGEETAGGRTNPANLEDAVEALVAAIYLDGGYEAAKAFITPRWRPLAQAVKTPPKDAKTGLQEWAQGHGLALPTYRVVETTGPAHAPEFTVEVSVENATPTQAKAATKRAAEQQAAKQLLAQLEKNA